MVPKDIIWENVGWVWNGSKENGIEFGLILWILSYIFKFMLFLIQIYSFIDNLKVSYKYNKIIKIFIIKKK